MFSSVSKTVGLCCLSGYSAMGAYTLPGSAVSNESRTLTAAATAIMTSAEHSQSLFGEKAAVISSLMALANKCAMPDWDGNDALSLSPISLQNAELFLRALPDDLPLPECAPDPDGSITFDWTESRYRRLSVSVGSCNRLAYAWLDGADSGHAVERFDGVTIPRRLLSAIESIITNEHTKLRAA
jgi:hypothetical protein